MKDEKYTSCKEGRPPEHKRKNANAQPRGALRPADQPIRAHASADQLRFHAKAAHPLTASIVGQSFKTHEFKLTSNKCVAC